MDMVFMTRNKNGGKAHTLSRTRNIDKKKHSCIAI